MSDNRENTQALSLVQALLGNITANLRAVSFECSVVGVVLYFLLEHESLEDREEIEDTVFEFEALQPSGSKIEVIATVDPRPLPTLRNGIVLGRLVFARKEQEG